MRPRKPKSRRRFIKTVGTAGVLGSALGMPGVINGATTVLTQLVPPVISPVEVSEDRVIRTVIGLRPFRPSGFRIETEKLDDKLIVHNYGHGGGGVSLSWGTATLALEKLNAPAGSKIAVLGCGVIGLSTAILLQREGYLVTIYSKDLPPETTSNVAAALWAPVSVYEEDKVGSAFLNDFNRASQISHRMFQGLVGERYGAHWLTTYMLGGEFDYPGGDQLYPAVHKHGRQTSPFDYDYTEEFQALLIEPPIYLRALMEDFRIAGGRIEVRDFGSMTDISRLSETFVMNCTGLGSHQLFGDTELTPVKGQLSVLLPQPEIDYSYVVMSYSDLLYMFPRKDGIILGGTMEKGNWSLDTSQAESIRILNGHRKIAAGLRR